MNSEKNPPWHAFMGESWGVFSEFCGDKLPRDILSYPILSYLILSYRHYKARKVNARGEQRVIQKKRASTVPVSGYQDEYPAHEHPRPRSTKKPPPTPRDPNPPPMTFWTNQQSDYTPKDLGVRPKPIMKVRYRQTSNIKHNLLGNKLPRHSDVVEASPAGAAPTTSSFST